MSCFTRHCIAVMTTLFYMVTGCSLQSTKAKPIHIIYIAKLKNESFHDGIASGIRKEMVVLGMNVDFFYAKNQQDVETQKQHLTALAEKKNYDGLMLAPNDSEALIPYVTEVDRAGIPFILIDTPLSDTTTSVFRYNCGFVGTDNVLAGKLAARYIIERIPQGTIFMMRGNHKHRSSIDRERGFVEEIQARPEYHLIGYVQGWWETDAAYESFSEFMRRHHQPLEAVFAYSDPIALGVNRFFEERKHLKRPVIVGVDGTLVGQRGVLLNQIDATVAQAPEVMGKRGLRNLLECIKNGATTSNMLTPVTLLKATLTLERVDDS